jgi:hypothetical protein
MVLNIARKNSRICINADWKKSSGKILPITSGVTGDGSISGRLNTAKSILLKNNDQPNQVHL